MVRRSIRVRGADAASVDALTRRFERIRDDLGVPAAFPEAVVHAAGDAAAHTVREAGNSGWADLRDVPFATVDPVGSTDLDQAMALSRRPDGGWHVDYAIADVPAFLPPGGPVDTEARRRGQTLYAPDRRTPLHPEVLSEDAASLLPNADRPAFVWRFDLAPDGTVTHLDLVRAVVRSRARLDYGQVQSAADAHPRPDPSAPVPLPADEVAALAVLLREIGVARQGLEQARGGASLPLPEQEVQAENGRYRVVLRPALPSEDWNAQLSLMTGMAAAELMLRGGVGLLRTLPAPEQHAVDRYRHQVKALGVPWPGKESYGEFLRRLDRTVPAHLAAMHEAGALFRGAGYTPFDGTEPAVRVHAAVAAPYAHVTAPLRRLVDRFGLLVCHAVAAGGEVPGWVREALPALPEAMAASDHLAGELERRCVDTVEAAVLADRVGQVFDAVAVDVGKDGQSGKVQMLDPAVLVRARGPLTVGTAVKVRLDAADPDTGQVTVTAVQ